MLVLSLLVLIQTAKVKLILLDPTTHFGIYFLTSFVVYQVYPKMLVVLYLLLYYIESTGTLGCGQLVHFTLGSLGERLVLKKSIFEELKKNTFQIHTPSATVLVIALPVDENLKNQMSCVTYTVLPVKIHSGLYVAIHIVLLLFFEQLATNIIFNS